MNIFNITSNFYETHQVSHILHKPILIQNIRAGRENPGLRAQHLSGVVLLSMLPSRYEYQSLLSDCQVGSSKFTYLPVISKKREECENTHQNGIVRCEKTNTSPPEVKIMYLENETSIELSADCMTAGATTLMIQSSLCPLLYFDSNGKNVKVIYKGGTNVDFSPPFEQVSEVFLPLLKKYFLKDLNALEIELECKQRGFFPKGKGQVELIMTKNADANLKGKCLSPMYLIDRGETISKIVLKLFYTEKEYENIAEKIEQAFKFEFEKHFPEHKFRDTPIIVTKERVTNNPARSRVIFGNAFMYDTNEQCVFEASFHSKNFSKKTKKQHSDFKVDDHIVFVKTLIQHLKKNWQEQGCVDEHVQDQIIIFMALAKGTSRVRTGPLTLHTQTAIHYCQIMTGVTFKVESQENGSVILECEGAGVALK